MNMNRTTLETILGTIARTGKDIFLAWAVIFGLLVLPAIVDKMIF